MCKTIKYLSNKEVTFSRLEGTFKNLGTRGDTTTLAKLIKFLPTQAFIEFLVNAFLSKPQAIELAFDSSVHVLSIWQAELPNDKLLANSLVLSDKYQYGLIDKYKLLKSTQVALDCANGLYKSGGCGDKSYHAAYSVCHIHSSPLKSCVSASKADPSYKHSFLIPWLINNLDKKDENKRVLVRKALSRHL